MDKILEQFSQDLQKQIDTSVKENADEMRVWFEHFNLDKGKSLCSLRF